MASDESPSDVTKSQKKKEKRERKKEKKEKESRKRRRSEVAGDVDEPERKRAKKERRKSDSATQFVEASSMVGIVEKLREDREKQEKGEAGGVLDIQLMLDTVQANRTADGGFLRLKDVQDLICWLYDVGPNPRWAFVRNKDLVRKVVVLGLGGLDLQVYEEHKSALKSLDRLNFLPLVKTRCPGSKFRVFSTLQTFLVRSCKKKKTKKKSGSTPIRSFPASFFALSRDELVDNNYTLEADVGEHPGYITFEDKAVPIGMEILAIDCEMCLTREGSELTRVTVVDRYMKVVYDTLVKPRNAIIDYVTQFSGITKEMLDPCETRIEQAQEELKKLIGKQTILVGHSLENDLRALKVAHNRVADTSVLYPHERGPPSKKALRNLTRDFLDYTIQNNAQLGHDSAQDAMAAMRLFLLKLDNGPTFGVPEESGRSLFQVLRTQQNVQSAMVDRPTLLETFRKHADVVPSSSDDETSERLAEQLSGGLSQFIWAQFHNLSSHVRAQDKAGEETAGELELAEGSEALGAKEEVAKLVEEMDNRVARAWNAAPENSIFILITGQANMNICRRLWQWKKVPGNTWTDKENALLEDAVAAARAGVTFIGVKNTTAQ